MSEHVKTSDVGPGGCEAALLALGRISIVGQPIGEVLEQVARLARGIIPCVEDAAVTLTSSARPHMAVSTGRLGRDLDERQQEAGAGPSLDVAASGGRIVIDGISAETAYPEFAREAALRRVTRSIFLGLTLGTRTVGGLSLYGCHDEPWDDAAVQVATTFAGYAAVAVANAVTLADALDEAAGLRAAAEARTVVEQLHSRDGEHVRHPSVSGTSALVDVCGGGALAAGVALAEVSTTTLWTEYIGLGGSMPLQRLRRYLDGVQAWPEIEHDLAAHALNERLWDAGMNSAVAYADDLTG